KEPPERDCREQAQPCHVLQGQEATDPGKQQEWRNKHQPVQQLVVRRTDQAGETAPEAVTVSKGRVPDLLRHAAKSLVSCLCGSHFVGWPGRASTAVVSVGKPRP